MDPVEACSILGWPGWATGNMSRILYVGLLCRGRERAREARDHGRRQIEVIEEVGGDYQIR